MYITARNDNDDKMDLVMAVILPCRRRVAAGLSVACHPLSFAVTSLHHLFQFVSLSVVFAFPSLSVCLSAALSLS